MTHKFRLKIPSLARFLVAGAIALAAIIGSRDAVAISESRVGTRHPEQINAILRSHGFDFQTAQPELAQSGVAELDILWQARHDFAIDATGQPSGHQLWLSRFDVGLGAHPLVILPGFTEFRGQYVELVHDLAQQGYGPIYVVDFQNHGASYQSQLKPGERLPTVREFIAAQKPKLQKLFWDKFHQFALSLGSEEPQLKQAMEQLPVGLGHTYRYSDFADNIDDFMNFITHDLDRLGVHEKATLFAHSAGALSLLVALSEGRTALESAERTADDWPARTEHIFFVSPLVGLRMLSIGADLPNIAAKNIANILFTGKDPVAPVSAKKGMTGYLNKATGHFSPDNSVSSSENRLTLSDAIRTWNGYETAGATNQWALSELNTEYQPSDLKSRNSLNQGFNDILFNLSKNHIRVTVVAAGNDTIAKTQTTIRFFERIKKQDASLDVDVVTIDGARHVLHQEADLYRDQLLSKISDRTNTKKALSCSALF